MWIVRLQEATLAAKAAGKASKATIEALREKVEALAEALRSAVAITLCCCDALESAATRTAVPTRRAESSGREALSEVCTSSVLPDCHSNHGIGC